MIPHQCMVSHKPPHSYGDCVRACIASLLNFERSTDVPHFYRDGDDERGKQELHDWLFLQGYRPFWMAIQCSVDDLFTMMDGVNHDIDYLLFCTAGGGNHVVICRNAAVIHDPAWIRSSITGPADNGYYVVMVLVKV